MKHSKKYNIIILGLVAHSFPALQRIRQENPEFSGSLGYIVRLFLKAEIKTKIQSNNTSFRK